MKKLVLLLFLACSGCGIFHNKNLFPQKAVTPPELINKDTIITKRYMEMGGLYDRQYELTIRGTGEVTLKGKYGAREYTNEQWNISLDDLTRLVET